MGDSVVMAELESGQLEAAEVSFLLESNEQEVETPGTEQEAQMSVSSEDCETFESVIYFCIYLQIAEMVETPFGSLKVVVQVWQAAEMLFAITNHSILSNLLSFLNFRVVCRSQLSLPTTTLE